MKSISRKKNKKLLGGLLGLSLITIGSFSRAKKRMLSNKQITGLFFHNPSQKLFLRCIKWLKKNNFTFISTNQLLDILHIKSIPDKKLVWITFDDGWKDNITEVVPIVIKYNLPVTFFISTTPVENGFFWFSLARKYIQHLPPEYKRDINRLWSVPESKRKEIIRHLERKVKSVLVREAMTLEEVRYLSDIRNVTIGAHTSNHVILTRCNSSELYSELKQSKLKLEGWTGKKVDYLAYPHGAFNDEVIKNTEIIGFKLAATIEKRPISGGENPLLVPRYVVNDDAFFLELLCQMVGSWGDFFSKWVHFKKKFNLFFK